MDGTDEVISKDDNDDSEMLRKAVPDCDITSVEAHVSSRGDDSSDAVTNDVSHQVHQDLVDDDDLENPSVALKHQLPSCEALSISTATIMPLCNAGNILLFHLNIKCVVFM